MTEAKPKTHNVIHRKIKPGESFTLRNGDTIENLGTHNIFIRVKRPLVIEGTHDEERSKKI